MRIFIFATCKPLCDWSIQLIRGGDANAVRLVDDYDWYIMPVMNPDGYAFTHVEVRFH